jgi:putative membrane protein insertion efficiency factor
MKSVVLFIIKFYQKYLTILSWGSCRYYPTCSSYAKIQFEHNSFFKALYYSIIRVLRCNPLFRGGFDYPKLKCIQNDKLNLKFTKIKVKYWRVPSEDGRCYIIQNKIWEVDNGFK